MAMSRDQIAGRHYNIGIDNSFFETVEQPTYLGTILACQNSIQEEIGADLSQEIPCIIRYKIVCLPVCCLKI